MRLFGVIFPVGCAIVLPNMATIVGIIGGVAATALGGIVPFWMYMAEYGDDLSKWEQALCIAAIVITAGFGGWATVDSLVECI